MLPTTSTTTTLCHYFFLNIPATTKIYTLSLHDALPIYAPAASDSRKRRWRSRHRSSPRSRRSCPKSRCAAWGRSQRRRSEEHTSELQSHSDLVCRLLLEKKKPTKSRARRAHWCPIYID